MRNPLKFLTNLSIKAPQPATRSGLDWVHGDILPDGTDTGSTRREGQDEFEQRRALRLPAVFTSANNIAKMLASYQPRVVRQTGPDAKAEEIKNHPFERILWRPNPWMSWTFLSWFSFLSLLINGNSYNFVVDDGSGGRDVQELWPIPPWRVTPIPADDTDKFIRYFEYRTSLNGEPIKLGQRHICWTWTPNIENLFDGVSSVNGAGALVDTARHQDAYRRNFFGPMNARPTAVYTIKKPVSTQQFQQVKREILSELQVMNRAALVNRAGDLDVNVLGTTMDDLGLIQFSDHDSRVLKEVFGWSEALGAKNTTMASAYAAEDIVKEYTAWPLAKLFAGAMTSQIVAPRYSQELAIQYSDFRTGRKADIRADYTTYAPEKTTNELRAENGLEPITEGPMSEIANMIPVRLLPYYAQVLQVSAKPAPTAALPPEPERKAILDHIDKWERKSLRRLGESGVAATPFESDAIPDSVTREVSPLLMLASAPAEVKEIFNVVRGGYCD